MHNGWAVSSDGRIMADAAGTSGSSSCRVAATDRFRFALAAASFVLIGIGCIRGSGARLLNDPISDAGFILGVFWLGVACAQAIGRIICLSKKHAARLNRSSEPEAATFVRNQV